jgi:membrane-bound ClpP family serine protease
MTRNAKFGSYSLGLMFLALGAACFIIIDSEIPAIVLLILGVVLLLQGQMAGRKG